mmetsp:Transcript_77628/g.154000  ORF Transcript_77628/g.154000 Transcript_77628/m.154000 type:complete len:263 (+) Transcript_77628:323-1111(+)
MTCDPGQHCRLQEPPLGGLGHELLRAVLAALPRSCGRDFGSQLPGLAHREQLCGQAWQSGTGPVSQDGASGSITTQSVSSRAVHAGVRGKAGCSSSKHLSKTSSVVPVGPTPCVTSCRLSFMSASPAASMHVSISASCVPAILSVGSTCASIGSSTRSSPEGGNGDAACGGAAGTAIEPASLGGIFASRIELLAARSLTCSCRRRALDRKKRSGRSVLSLGPISPLMCLKSSAALLSSASNPGRSSRRIARCCCSTTLIVSR